MGPAQLILLDFTTRTIFGKKYRSLSSLLCNFLHSPVTLSLLGPNTLLNSQYQYKFSYVILDYTQNSIEVDAETKESTRKTEEKLDGRNKEGHERKKPK
jgi:hypothetical protein